MPDPAVAYLEVKQRVAAAARRAGRQPEDITLVAVSKTRGVEDIQQVITAGAVDLGENYVQELIDKQVILADKKLKWHFIGHLQRNKVKYLAPFIGLIHAVDSERLAEEISRRGSEINRKIPILLEVNISGEESKFGLNSDTAGQLAQTCATLTGLELCGLMTMTPFGVTSDEARRHFNNLRDLAQQLQLNLPAGAMRDLSMGMTQDFEVAVEEGATLVRVGTAIFGVR